jgi:hypothetical protein
MGQREKPPSLEIPVATAHKSFINHKVFVWVVVVCDREEL